MGVVETEFKLSGGQLCSVVTLPGAWDDVNDIPEGTEAQVDLEAASGRSTTLQVRWDNQFYFPQNILSPLVSGSSFIYRICICSFDMYYDAGAGGSPDNPRVQCVNVWPIGVASAGNSQTQSITSSYETYSFFVNSSTSTERNLDLSFPDFNGRFTTTIVTQDPSGTGELTAYIRNLRLSLYMTRYTFPLTATGAGIN